MKHIEIVEFIASTQLVGKVDGTTVAEAELLVKKKRFVRLILDKALYICKKVVQTSNSLFNHYFYMFFLI